MGLNAKFCCVRLKPDDCYYSYLLMSINDLKKTKQHFVYFMLTLLNSSFLMKMSWAAKLFCGNVYHFEDAVFFISQAFKHIKKKS